MDAPSGPGFPPIGAPDPDSLQLGDDIRHLIAPPPETASSFTALLELPANQAVELLHSPDSSIRTRPGITGIRNPYQQHQLSAGSLTFPTDIGLIERAARFSAFAAGENSPETSNSGANAGAAAVKSEPAETESLRPLVSDPAPENRKAAKRKEREKKAKGSSKKSKIVTKESAEDAEKLPYVHVRARRGQATDSHSLAERARREKINARMKLLQELVPGCNKISGTALVLDEIINHVQSLQRQVELLSMRLAAVNPRIDFNLDSILAADDGSVLDCNFPNMVMPLNWPEVHVNGNRQQYQQQWHFDALNQPVWGREEDGYNFIAPENSLLSYDSSANSGGLN